MNSRPILLVTNDLGPRAGGIESFILGLLGELDGSQIVIYTSTQEGCEEFDRQLERKHGLLIYRDKAKVLLPTPRVNRRIAKVMKEYSSEIIWYGAAAPLGWMAGYLRRYGAKRQVALTHGHEVWWSKVWPFSFAMRVITSHLDVITYLGEFTHTAMLPILSEKVSTIRMAPGIATAHFSPGPKSAELIDNWELRNHRVIISVGRLVHRKGQDRLIEAMPAILREIPDAILVLIGEGPRRAFLEKLVSKYQLQEKVRFVGRVQYADLPSYLRLGDIFAMPSRSRFFGLEVEGLGIVYLEASSTGIPILGSTIGGAPDAVLDGETGVVVDGANIEAIATAAISLLNNPQQRREMGRRGREWAVEAWSWKLWGERFSAILFGE